MMLWFKALPLAGKIGSLLGVVALVGLLAFGFGRWKESLRNEGRAEVQAKWDAAKQERKVVLAEFQGGLTASLQPIFAQLGTTLRGIDAKQAQVNVRLPEILAADPRYRDPGCALTPDALAEVNGARALSQEPVR